MTMGKVAYAARKAFAEFAGTLTLLDDCCFPNRHAFKYEIERECPGGGGRRSHGLPR